MTLNVSSTANITSLNVGTFANIISANIVTAVHSNLNVFNTANIFTANLNSGNVVTTFNVATTLSASLHVGNASGLSNINASNVTMGILPFRNDGAIGLGPSAISINGSTGVNNQYLASTGTSLQWVGPPAAIFSQVPTSVNQIFYNSGNVAIGPQNWTLVGTGYNTYPGTPLDVYGGSGSFSNVSDAVYSGAIRIQNNAGSWASAGGLEFKTGTNVAGCGHRLVTIQDPIVNTTAPLIFQYRFATNAWSNAMAIQSGGGQAGYVGIGTMAPGYQLHIYQPSTSAAASLVVQFSGASQSSQLYLSNPSGTSTVLYLNGPSLSSDGPANSATLRNNAGDLRLAGASTQPYIYLQTATNSVGFGTQTMVASSNVSFWCPNVSSSGFAHTVSADSKLGASLYAGDPGQGQFVITGVTNTNKRLAFMYDTSNNISLIQSMTAGTGTNPLIINGAGGNVGIGTTTNLNCPLTIYNSASTSTYTGTTAWGNIHLMPQGTNNSWAGITFGGSSSGTIQQTTQASITVDSNSSTGTNMRFNVGYLFAGGALERMTIIGNGGLVGIGSASPRCTLDVVGSGTTEGIYAKRFYLAGPGDNTDSSGNLNDGGPWYGLGYSVDTGLTSYVQLASFYGLALKTGGGGYPILLIGGNVGIGSTSPATNLDVAKTTGAGTPAIEIRGAGGGPRLQVYGRNADAQAWMGLGTDMAGGPYEHAIYFPNANSAANGFLTFGSYNGTAYSEKMRITIGGNVGIGTATPATRLHVYNGDSSTATFGPNATWGATLRVGSGNQYNSGTSGLASVIATNGNLHIDSGTGQNLYLQYFVNGAGVGGPTNSYGSWSHTGAMTVSAVLTGNGGYSGYGTQNYFGGYAATAGNGFDFEDQTTFMRMAQRNVRWYDWNGAGDFFYAHNGCVGIRTDQTSSVFEVAGRSYIWGTSLASGGQNRFTGLEGDGSANGRAQLVLNSSYSDMIICSSQTNGNHGSTISFTTNSTANNDYRKFVIDQNNWGVDASGTGGYGDRLCFDWRDAAYTNPHSYVDPGNATMTLYGRGHSVGINSVRTPGYNLQVSGNDYTSGGRYTSDYFRIYGGGGIYWQDYGGGWYMADTTYMRVNNDKWIYTGGYIQSAAGFRVGDGRVIIDSSYNHWGWFRPYNDGWHYCNAGYRRFYFANAGRTYIEGNDGVEIRRSDDTYVAIFNNDLTIDFRSTVRSNGEVICTNINAYGQFRAIGGNYGSFIRNDGSDTYWLVTNQYDQYGGYNGLRPFHFNNSTGYVRCDNGLGASYINSDGDIIAYNSDIRTKTVIGPITNALDKLLSLSTFHYVNNDVAVSMGLEADRKYIGLSAQEVEKVCPEVVRPAPFDLKQDEKTGKQVSKSGENYKTIQYDRFLPFVIAALKEETAKRKELEKEVAELRQLVENILTRQ